jgi:hypothetical protein
MWGAYLPTLYSGAKPADFAAEKARALASIRRPGFARAFSLTTRTDHAPAEAALAAVTAPTLVVMGEKDPDFRDQAGVGHHDGAADQGGARRGSASQGSADQGGEGSRA